MKKLILSVAVLAAFASCSKDEVTEVAPAQQATAIGFSTLNDRVTKAANLNAHDGTNEGSASTAYTVYSIVNAATDVWYIEDEDVTASTDGFVNTSSVYYWPVTDKLDFYAFAPSDGIATGTLSVTSSKTEDGDTTYGNLDLAYTVNNTASEDFTVAAPIKEATSEYQDGATADLPSVPLVFSHMLAKATISIQTGDTGYTLTLGSATFNVTNNAITVDATASSPAPALATSQTAANYTYALESTSAVALIEGEQELMFAHQTSTDDVSISLTSLNVYNENGILVYSGSPKYEFATSQVFAYGTAYAITLTVDVADTELGIPTIAFLSSIITDAWTSATTSLSEN